MSDFLRHQIINLYQIATGRRFLTRLKELKRQEQLGRAELLSLQQTKRQRLLENAYTFVPYYKRVFDEVGFQPTDILRDPTAFQKVPLLNKPLIREHFNDLQTTHPKIRSQLSSLTTSGSSGQPLKLMQDNAFRDHVTADVHRHLSWAGWELGTPHCYIWGANFEIAAKQTLRARLMDWALNRFVTNAYVLSEESMAAFVKEVRNRRPEILFSYPSSLQRFAEFVRQNDLNDVKFNAILSSAEVLYPDQRQFIEETFSCKIFDRYGTREVGGLGCQCEYHTGLHVSMENVYIEIVKDNGQPALPGEPGNIIITNLNNYGMPFIRYHLTDVVSWYPENNCPCGRAHPMLSVVEGRHNDMFKTRDGRLVWGGIANPLWGMAGVKQFQFIQKRYDLVVVRIVKEGEVPITELTKVERTVRTALGDQVEVWFEFPEEIPAEKSGKYRYQICEIDQQPFDNTIERELHHG